MADLEFHGPDREYIYTEETWSEERGTYYRYEYPHLQASFKLHVEESHNAVTGKSTLTLTAFIKLVTSTYGGVNSTWVDGDVIWRPKPTSENPNPAWQVVGAHPTGGYTFSAYHGWGNVYLPAADNTYRQITTDGTNWIGTIADVSVKDIQIGIRRRAVGAQPFNNFGVYLTRMNSWNNYQYPYCFPPGDSDALDYQSVIDYREYETEADDGQTSGIVRIDAGTEWKTATVWIDTGSAWVQAIPYVDTGSAWVQCN